MSTIPRLASFALSFMIPAALGPPHADAQDILVTDCGTVIAGKGQVGVLQNDIDCITAGVNSGAILMTHRTTLRLNGFSIRSAAFAIDCVGKCTIEGPGAITTDGNACGIQVAQNTKARLELSDLDIHDNAKGICAGSPTSVKTQLTDVTVRNSTSVGIGGATFRAGKVKGSGVTVTDNGSQGIAADKIRLEASSIQGNGQSGIFGKSVKLSDTEVSGSVAAADLAAAKRPKLKGTSTCGASSELSEYPAATFGPSWNVCADD
jgi:hypothetical protein